MRAAWRHAARNHAASAFAVFVLALASGATLAQTPAMAQETFAPPTERGPVVIVASGTSGTELYREFSADLAAQGYYVVLVDGKDVSIRPNDRSRDGAASMRSLIRDAQASPRATPGKVALIGLSLGGIGTLAFGAPLKEQVSAIVLFYPALTRVGSDLTALSSAMQVPTLVFAGGKDNYRGCCTIETMRAFEAAPKSVSFQLVVYPEANHAFNLKRVPPPFEYRQADADDASKRTLEFLARYQPVAGH
ncbi:MAG: dienelactone hydrolase family protein [Caldimonas sp.]